MIYLLMTALGGASLYIIGTETESHRTASIGISLTLTAFLGSVAWALALGLGLTTS